MPLPAQAKLLRVLQEGDGRAARHQRVDRGRRARHLGDPPQPAASAIAEGLFREDLYYRLNVLEIEIPPLRERRGDLPLLLQHFLRRFTPAGQAAADASRRAPGRCCRSTFPGNVRELAHAIEHAVVLAGGGEIELEHLPADIAGAASTAARHLGRQRCARWRAALKEFEREYLLRALAPAGGKRTRAAEMLGISRKNLWEKLRLHGIAAETEAED